MIRWLWPLLLLLESGRNGDAPNDDAPPPAGDEEEEEVRDPKALVKALREANARLAKKLEKRDERIKELEGRAPDNEGALRSARLESAFVRAVFDHRDSVDLEAAWDLATYKGFLDGVKVEDEGTVDTDGMEAALERLVARYPYLIEDGEPPSSDGATLPTTRQPKPPASGRAQADRGALERRFSALRDRGRRR